MNLFVFSSQTLTTDGLQVYISCIYNIHSLVLPFLIDYLSLSVSVLMFSYDLFIIIESFVGSLFQI